MLCDKELVFEKQFKIRTMKKLSLILIAIVASFSSYAQSSFKEDIEVLQCIYGKSKSDLVKEYMNLSDSHAVAFAKVYECYEADRKVLGRTKFKLISEYVTNYATLTGRKANELAKATLINHIGYEKLYTRTYTQTKKVIGAINAAKFIQLEVYLQSTIKAEIQKSIPFIDELHQTKIQILF